MKKKRENYTQMNDIERDTEELARTLAKRYIRGFSHVADGFIFIEDSNKKLTKNFSFKPHYYKEKKGDKKGVKISYKAFNYVNMLLPNDRLFDHIDRRILFNNSQMQRILSETISLVNTLDESCRDKLEGYDQLVSNDDYFCHYFFEIGEKTSKIYEAGCSSELLMTENGLFHILNFQLTYAKDNSSMGISFNFSLMKKDSRLYLYDCVDGFYKLTSYTELNKKLLASNTLSFYYLFQDLGIQTNNIPNTEEIKKNLPLVSLITF